ncbi:unnamed protein product [Somion occarium]|uniref:Peptidase S9 prolyl oligopeptidase catalytic domain-containing protein n=1 Tax=Somion occarium TaxID=3059160 RepID=A0ABP1DAG7_9APHY
MAEAEPQHAFDLRIPHKGNETRWTVSISDEWDVLGPFPIHAREQHFLSPSFPIDHGGSVGWTKATSSNGNLAVSFPDVRWDSLRRTEGWAALQHHSLLRTAIVIQPLLSGSTDETLSSPRLSVSMLQGSLFTITPSSPNLNFTPKWYAGNIYAMGASLPQAVSLPEPPSPTEPTVYHLFLSGDYEIRLFGDPKARGSDVPELQISYTVEIEHPREALTVQPTHHVVPDFVDGWAFGDAFGIGLRSVDGWWTVTDAKIHNEEFELPTPTALHDTSSLHDYQVLPLRPSRLAPTQTRIIPLRFTQKKPLCASELHLELSATSHTGVSLTIHVTLHVKQQTQWNSTRSSPIKATYFFAGSMPTGFLVTPPKEQKNGQLRTPLLALHGAGVDIFAQDFWPQALPRQQYSWIIMPIGRTSWGLDWHGPSAEDAWSTVDALFQILQGHHRWHPWRIANNSRVVLLGHSNGGQGTWYMASRHPDRVVAAVPAAAYIKSQAYIPLTLSRSAHYMDPSLRSILESSLTPDDNDLFISNLAGTPVLAVHGGDDENVPVWHTREAVSVFKTWYPDANITFKEDAGESHWYPTVFDNDEVQDFIRSAVKQANPADASSLHSASQFTLTVAVPRESGSLNGWRILQLRTPGRLGRLTVEVSSESVSVKTQNVAAFSIKWSTSFFDTFIIDDSEVNVDFAGEGTQLSFVYNSHRWQVLHSQNLLIQFSGRMYNIFATAGPLTIIIPNNSSSVQSAAARLAHDLDTYHKLDAEIVYAEAAVRQLTAGSLSQGNLILLGGASNTFTHRLLAAKHTVFSMNGEYIRIRGKPVDPTFATLFLHPHSTNPAGLVLISFTSNDSALERAMRLFPMRTGITLPDWIMVSDLTDSIGSGGVQAAGVWKNNWTWNEPMSFIHAF